MSDSHNNGSITAALFDAAPAPPQPPNRLPRAKKMADLRLTQHIATRGRTTDFMGLAGWLPNPDIVLRKSGKTIHVYNDLRTDAHVAGALQSRKAATLKLEWTLDMEATTLDKRAATAIDKALKGLHMRRVLSEILDAFADGYRVLEVIWDFVAPPEETDITNPVPDAASVDPSTAFLQQLFGPAAGAPVAGGIPGITAPPVAATPAPNGIGIQPLPPRLLMPVAIVGKPAHWFRFDPDNRLRFITNFNAEGELVPQRKFLVAQNNATYDNPYGEATLSRCYWPVTIKRGDVKLWLTLAERFGLPWVVGKYPRSYNDDQAQDFLDKLAIMNQDGVMAAPDDAEISVEANGFTGNADVFAGLLAWCNSEISKAILGHTGSIDSTPGKLGSEDAAIGVRSDFADADKQLAEATINQLIDWIYELNFDVSPEGRTRFTLYQEEDIDIDLANRDKVLYDSGIRFTKEYYVAKYGLKPEHFDIPEPAAPPAGAPGTAPPGAPSGAPPATAIPGLFAAGGGCDAHGNAFAKQPPPPQPPSAFPDQMAMENIMANVSPGQLQDMMEPAVGAVRDMLAGVTSYEEATAMLAKLYPNLDTGLLEQSLTSIILLGETVGRAGVDEEAKEEA